MTIRLAEYDSKWPQLFRLEALAIRRALAHRALRIEHVGSTSVPGLAAKPVIDVLLAIADSADEAAYVPALEHAGYVLRIREPQWNQHRMFNAPGREVNLHVYSHGCQEIDRIIQFRDWLRSNETDRALYEQTKRALALKSWTSVQDYADAKTGVIGEILGRANPQQQ